MYRDIVYLSLLSDTDLYECRKHIIYLHWKDNLNELVMKAQKEKLDHYQIKETDTWIISKKIKLTLNFIRPMLIPVGACHRSKTTHKSMAFHFWSSGEIVRRFKRGGSSGYHLSDEIYQNIASWKVDIIDDSMTFEEFRNKFDKRFITEKELKLSWENGSAQHGGEYQRTDFKTMSKRGRDKFKQFLEKFHSITCPTEEYEEGYSPVTSNKDSLRTNYTPYGDTGRTIGISHEYPRPYILYVTENARGGREQCYIVANKNEVLHLEND